MTSHFDDVKMSVAQEDYERAQAIIAHAVITASVSQAYPALTIAERDRMIFCIIERLARMRGFELRRLYACQDEGE